jgi:hypothetical protein
MESPQSDPIREAILARARAGLTEASERCAEALQHLHNRDHVAALGALAGLDERVRYVSTILSVLRDLEAAQRQPSIEFDRQKGGEKLE